MNLNKTISIIIILTIPYLILIANFIFLFYNEDFYYNQFEKNNVNVKDKELILQNLLNFFKNREDLDYFNENEKAHLIDVKNLINKFIFIFYVFIIIDILFLFSFFFYKKILNIKKILLYSGILTIFIILIFFILSLNFDFLFTNFHKLFFTGNWIFPRESLLIQLFSFNFFKNYFLKILINSFLISLVLILINFVTNKRFINN